MFRNTSRFATFAATGAARTLLAGAMVAVLFAAGLARAEAANSLQAVDVQTLSGQQVQVRLRLSAPAPEPMSFTIDRPARIAIDLPDTTLALDTRRIDVKSGGLDTILAAEAGGRTRLVFNLDAPMDYTTRVDGNIIYVILGAAQSAMASPGAESQPAPRAAVATGRDTISNIDFRRGADGAGRVVVQMSNSRIPVNLTQQGTQVLVDFGGADLPQDLMRRYDVADFATPVQTVDAMKVGTGTRLVITSGGNFQQLAYQTDNVYAIEIRQMTQTEVAEKTQYTGERLTLNFQDIETRAVLQLLADTSGQNIVVSDSVQGNVTLRLQNVPWDQALDIVLQTKGLDKRQHDNVIIVGPTGELATNEKAALEAQKEVQALSPLRTELIQVNYAKASNLAALIKASGENSLLSSRGSVVIDERTNTLLIQDTSERLQDIRQLVSQLDISIKQVQIEARIVIVNDDFERNLGVRWGTTVAQTLGPSGTSVISGSGLNNGQDDDTGPPVTVGNRAPESVVGTIITPPVEDRYMVNLPVADPAGRLALTLLDSEYIVDLELSAAQAEGRGEVISAPRIVTANQSEAIIKAGVEIPYQEAASSGATTIQFKEATLSLKVTPQITPDNTIILTLVVNKDSVGQIVVSSAGADVPSIDTREISATVQVNDGQTVVLGGILETEQRHTETKVPVLGDIPGIGRLFKNISKTNNKDELLIFITPRILRDGSSLY